MDVAYMNECRTKVNPFLPCKPSIKARDIKGYQYKGTLTLE